jgi:hypothetical protein
VLDHFGKDHHELLLRQLFYIRQSGTVSEYVDKFSGLVDQLVAYGHNTDPLFYTVYGDDIRSAVQLQPPFSFDVACVLTLLQEELADPSQQRELRNGIHCLEPSWSRRSHYHCHFLLDLTNRRPWLCCLRIEC